MQPHSHHSSKFLPDKPLHDRVIEAAYAAADDVIAAHFTRELRTHYRITEAAIDEVLDAIHMYVQDETLEVAMRGSFAKILKQVYVRVEASDASGPGGSHTVKFSVDDEDSTECCTFESRLYYRLDFACRQAQAEPRDPRVAADPHFAAIVALLKPRDAAMLRGP